MFVFWGGREGVDVDAAKDPIQTGGWFREAINFLCEYVISQDYTIKFAMEPKPNEPRGDLYLPTVGSRCWHSSRRWIIPKWSASTPKPPTSRWPV